MADRVNCEAYACGHCDVTVGAASCGGDANRCVAGAGLNPGQAQRYLTSLVTFVPALRDSAALPLIRKEFQRVIDGE